MLYSQNSSPGRNKGILIKIESVCDRRENGGRVLVGKMSKKKKKAIREECKKPEYNTRGLGFLVWLVVGTVLFYTVYRYAVTNGYMAAMWIYGGLLLAVALAYIIWNRGFSEWSLTDQDLPSDWDEKQKGDFLAGVKLRRERSKWLLALALPLLFTFFLDWAELFLLDGLRSFMGGGK